MDINTWLGSHSEEIDYDPPMQGFLDNENHVDTTFSEALWERIADGTAGVAETLLWAQLVAKRIRREVVRGAVSVVRERGALRAIGFYGPAAQHRDAKGYMACLASFDVLDSDGQALPEQRMTGVQWVRVLKGAGYFRETKDDRAIDLVNEWRKELKID